MPQRPWNGHEYANHHHDDVESDTTQGVVRERVQNLRAGQDVETNKHNVVGEQHKSSEFVCDLGLSAGIVRKVADIPNHGVLHDEAPHGHGGDPEEHAADDHCQDTRDPAEDGQ